MLIFDIQVINLQYLVQAWELLIYYFETEVSPNTHRTNNKQQPTLYSIYTSIYNKRERPVVYYLCPTGKLAIFSSKDNILNA